MFLCGGPIIRPSANVFLSTFKVRADLAKMREQDGSS